ncbi:putative glutathione s- protein [Emericellopsis cladophorae]|uniref:Glutathione s- protein n=1 Tax=Emericellopsis cladophorae TaxID=2686198 RepID=A0A9Q0BI05_9HYPO|nr:putative glutathione s- protein [Emericellopsis cladophorae]KAI6785014.1 putative glutathione s- protein [Emericellopsis cladophorae]
MSAPLPIKLYMHSGAVGGPNPYKVLIVLHHLDIPFTKVATDDSKAEWYVKDINPNGRIPAIEDPNTGLTLWESGAIIEYLVDEYDKGGKISVKNGKGAWEAKQYLHFQMSGQGPYFGQAVWFYRFGDNMPDGKKRYLEQVERVMMVLNNILEGKEYLVDDRLTYADLAFVPWNMVVQKWPLLSDPLWKPYQIEEKYPNFVKWQNKLCALDAVKRSYEP